MASDAFYRPFSILQVSLNLAVNIYTVPKVHLLNFKLKLFNFLLFLCVFICFRAMRLYLVYNEQFFMIDRPLNITYSWLFSFALRSPARLTTACLRSVAAGAQNNQKLKAEIKMSVHASQLGLNVYEMSDLCVEAAAAKSVPGGDIRVCGTISFAFPYPTLSVLFVYLSFRDFQTRHINNSQLFPRKPDS